MKKILFAAFTLMLIFHSEINAQYINNLAIYPTSPTDNDSVYFIASCYFQSGSCNDKTLSFGINNDNITCNAIHCIGLATYICYDTDTFSVGKLAAGNYTFHYNLNAGYGITPCTPGIITGPSDSLKVQINLASEVSEIDNHLLTIYPNPCSDYLTINNSNNQINSIIICDFKGRVCMNELVSHSQERLNLENIKPGIYLIKAIGNTTQEFVKLFFKL